MDNILPPPLVIDMMDGYQELYNSLKNDINEAKEGRIVSRKAQTVGIRRAVAEVDGEQSSILSKLEVISNRLEYQEFTTRLVKLERLTKLRRAAIEVMNGHMGLATAARAEKLPVEILVNEIKDIQAKGEFQYSEVLLKSKAERKKHKRIEDTGIVDPLSEESYVNVIYSENGFMDADEYDAIMSEFESIMKHKESRRG